MKIFCPTKLQYKHFSFKNTYKQVITKATTTYGTLLDHAYVKNCEVVYSDVYDMYYSDHDLIVLGVKSNLMV